MKHSRILLADDHSLMLAGICKLLADDFELVGQVDNGRSLVEEALRLRPDLVILDIAMPLLNGIEAARQIKKAWPEAALLFLTMHSEPFYLREALQTGAGGYLLKSSAAGELEEAISTVLKGGLYLTKSIPWQVRDTLSTPTGRLTRSTGLTTRQREVLQLLAEGHCNKEISAILQVSIKTVEFHRSQLMRTLGVHTVAELTRFALSLGLVNQEITRRSHAG
jgi:DNA-binding NarL/FixJ family response regulator